MPAQNYNNNKFHEFLKKWRSQIPQSSSLNIMLDADREKEHTELMVFKSARQGSAQPKERRQQRRRHRNRI